MGIDLEVMVSDSLLPVALFYIIFDSILFISPRFQVVLLIILASQTAKCRSGLSMDTTEWRYSPFVTSNPAKKSPTIITSHCLTLPKARYALFLLLLKFD